MTPEIEAEVLELTTRWVGDCGGLDVLVPIGAALNVLKTVGNYSPPEVRSAVSLFLQFIAKEFSDQPVQ